MDDRPVDDPVVALAKLTKDFEDFRSTIMARLTRKPTGSIEPTVLTTAKPDTLLLNGQLVSRTTYADLWAWAQTNNRVTSGLFTVGDGSTTFGLPNFSGRVLMGAGTLGADTYLVGQLVGEARVTLTLSQLPSHNHGGSTGDDNHTHTGSTNTTGGHGGHTNAPTSTTVNNGAGSAYGLPTFYNNNYGSHSHTLSINSDTHSHTISGAGNDQSHENRQPSIAVNWLIWV